jgi:hypothetical protein
MDKVYIFILVTCIVVMGVIFLLGWGQSNQSQEKKECDRLGGIYKTFYGSESVCFPPSAVIPVKK